MDVHDIVDVPLDGLLTGYTAGGGSSDLSGQEPEMAREWKAREFGPGAEIVWEQRGAAGTEIRTGTVIQRAEIVEWRTAWRRTGWEVVPGTYVWVAPDEPRAGEAVMVAVRFAGSGCRKGEAWIEEAGYAYATASQAWFQSGRGAISALAAAEWQARARGLAPMYAVEEEQAAEAA